MWGKKKKQAVTEKDWEEEKIAAMRATIRTKAMCAREYRHGFLHSDEKKLCSTRRQLLAMAPQNPQGVLTIRKRLAMKKMGHPHMELEE